MFFPFSKILGFVFEPANLVALALVLGLVLSFTRLKRIGQGLTGVATVLFLIMCFSPLGTFLLQRLENRFPHPDSGLPAPAGIIVLGGAMNEDRSVARGEISLDQAASRLTAGVVLARRFPKARLIFTGGSGDLMQNALPEADGVKRLWLDLGVPEARMIFESRSRNTYENAVFTRALLAPKPGERWLLVTSAWHMPRSMGIFRHAGFDVIAYPVDYRTFGDTRDGLPLYNAVASLERLDMAMHEWIGLVAYWLSGKTNALLPSP